MQEQPNLDHFNNLTQDSSIQEQKQDEYIETNNTLNEDFETGDRKSVV
jgi:hypothetical protein